MSSEYKNFIAQEDTHCDNCQGHINKGSWCLQSEEETICEDCGQRREAQYKSGVSISQYE
jgi:hypothetical protein